MPLHVRSEGFGSSIKMADDAKPPHWRDWEYALCPLLIASGAKELEVLNGLKRKGRFHESIEEHFKQQRDVSDNADAELEHTWFKKMRTIFKEIDKESACVDPEQPLKFLDLGCCPGGFSSYILNTHAYATGLGVSLPATSGGYKFLLEQRHRKRLQVFFTDLTYYRLGPRTTETSNRGRKLTVLPFDVRNRQFDMAVLDGHPLRTYLESENWHSHRLLVSQLVIGLQAVRPGGTLVVKLSKIELVRTAQILHMLDFLSSDLVTIKPKSMHASRSTFYAVATGLGEGTGGGRREEMLSALQALWAELTYGGTDEHVRFMAAGDLDFIVSVDELAEEGCLTRLRELATDVWKVQTWALRKLFDKKGVDFGDRRQDSSLEI